ncbi:MAG: prepilin peptidase [Clostridia bacterium]|nr:prepilin peptidase [Clostridia bacterium]
MLQIVLLIIIFILGIYFGSFFTLATYRLPKKEDITHKHSYCPNCNHKLGALDLVPVFSYIFLKGKCRYCKKTIGIRYFLFEILTGLVFVLFSISLKIDVYNLYVSTIAYFIIAILYFSSLFILAGIEKEKGIIQKSVLIYGVFVSLVYMIYSYTLIKTNVYEYVIYLSFMIILLLLDTKLLKKKLKYNYWIQVLILILYMLIFTGVYYTIWTVILAILSIGIKNILQFFKIRKSKIVKATKLSPIAFYLSISNIIVVISMNFIINYFMK